MKRVRLSKRDIEIILWALEEHKERILEKLKSEEDITIYKLLFEHNMTIRELSDRLRRYQKVESVPYKPKHQLIE